MSNRLNKPTSLPLSDFSGVGFCFDNSYTSLSDKIYSKSMPTPVRCPKLLLLNKGLAKNLNLDFSIIANEHIAQLFSGNISPAGSGYIAMGYAGHQFGYFTMLGDGRALLMGEHINKNKLRSDIQLKGVGKTKFSRNGDGRAALGPVLREYIISEAMHALNIPSTRSLAVVKTGEDVLREKTLKGAVLTRVANSHIRIGTFQYIASFNDHSLLKEFFNYALCRHFPFLINKKNPAVSFLKEVMDKQIDLVVNWMRVGFVHGVMNTDNVSISGETIDYGPCAFVDAYDPDVVFSSIDLQGRYSFKKQPAIMHWNMVRLAESLLPLIHQKQDVAIKIAGEVLGEYGVFYKERWFEMMGKKLGLEKKQRGDERLITDLLSWMYKSGADYTNTFFYLSEKDVLKKDFFKDGFFSEWYISWQKRLGRGDSATADVYRIMEKHNPAVIPRNHNVEESLYFADVKEDLDLVKKLIKVLKFPYNRKIERGDYQSPPPSGAAKYKTFCGT